MSRAEDASNVIRQAFRKKALAGCLDRLQLQVEELQLDAKALTVEAVASIKVGQDSREIERQLGDTLDALEHLRLRQWVLMGMTRS